MYLRKMTLSAHIYAYINSQTSLSKHMFAEV